MKTSMRRANGFIETVVAVETNKGLNFVYKKLRDTSATSVTNESTVVEEAVDVQYEVVAADYMAEEEWVDKKVEEAINRINTKISEFRQQTEIKQQAYQVLKEAHEVGKKERKRMRPRNKMHMLMDAVGIDRRAVYDMLCEIEKRMAN